MTTRRFEDELSCELSRLEEEHLLRVFRNIESEQGVVVEIDGKSFVNFCSNNYLNLSTHPKVVAASREAAGKFGTGGGASRHVSGNHALYEALEGKTAAFKGHESCLVFPTGYMANVGVLSALCGKNDVIFSDELNHASLIDGCRLSRAETKVYPHCDVNALESLLSENTNAKHKFIVTDGIFSMDGDCAPIPEIVKTAEKYDATLIVDDAHGTETLGENGKGIAEYFRLEGKIPVVVGTYSKALGSLGGFVCASSTVIDYLKNKARSLIYTTALPPSVLAASCAALDVAQEEPWRREKLQENAKLLRESLIKAGYNVGHGEHHIIPVIVGDTEKTLALSQKLYDAGILAVAIRPPTVPEGTSRIRFSVTTGSDLRILEKLRIALRKLNSQA